MKRQIFLICFISIFIAANAMINQKDAFAFSEKFSSESNSEIWVSNQQYAKGDTIFLWQGNLICPFESAWCVFIDNYPLANWGHECQYIFVDSSNGELKQFYQNQPPKKLSKQWTKFKTFSKDKDVDSTSKSSTLKLSKFSEQRNRLNTPGDIQEDAHLYAIIIDYCGEDPEYYYGRHWEDCAAIYNTLRAHGYMSDHIYTAMPYDSIDMPEMRISTGEFVQVTPDLDGDGVGDIRYNATTSDVMNLFYDISQVLTEDDLLFVYLTGNGDKAQSTRLSPYIGYLADERLGDTFIVGQLQNLDVRLINLIVQRNNQDFFAQKQSYTNANIKIAVSADDIYWRRNENATIDEYTRRWINAVNEESMLQCDLDGDGNISMYETHTYAIDSCLNINYHPQQFSLPACLIYDLTLTEELPNNPCLRSDLYIKDNESDNGYEPNTTTQLSYVSEDIWLEDTYGNMVNALVSNNEYYVCVRIRNRGYENSLGNEVLHVHWTKAVIGGRWPTSWDENGYYDCNGTIVHTGGEITPTTGEELPIIFPNDEYVVRIPWIAPDNSTYEVCSEFAGDDISQLWHYCLLARIYDENEQPGYDMQYQPMSTFVLNSNNVASRNITILSETNNDTNGSIVGVAVPFKGQFNLTGILFTPIDEFINNNFNVEIYLDNNLYANWSGDGDGFINMGDRIRLANPMMELQNIYLDEHELYALKVEVDNASLSDFVFDIVLTDNQGKAYGGERFSYQAGATPSARVSQRNNTDQSEKSTNESIACGETKDIRQVIVINALGQIVFLSNNPKTIDWERLPQGVYTIIVNYEDETITNKVIR